MFSDAAANDHGHLLSPGLACLPQVQTHLLGPTCGRLITHRMECVFFWPQKIKKIFEYFNNNGDENSIIMSNLRIE